MNGINLQCRPTPTIYERFLKSDLYKFVTARAGFSFIASVLRENVVETQIQAGVGSNAFAFVASLLRTVQVPLGLVNATARNALAFTASTLREVIKPAGTYTATARNSFAVQSSTLKTVVVPTFSGPTGTVKNAFAFTASALT